MLSCWVTWLQLVVDQALLQPSLCPGIARGHEIKHTKCSSSTWTLLGSWCCCCCCCCSPFSSLPPSSEVLVSIFSVAMATDHSQFEREITWLVMLMGVVGWFLIDGRGSLAQIQRRACPTSTAKEREREEMVIFVFHCFPYSLWFVARLVKEMHHLKHHHLNQK